MIKIKYAELHTPLFLAGVNISAKIEPHKRTNQSDISMVYDRSEKELHITLKGEMAIIPSTNIVSMIEGEVMKKAHVEPVAPITKITAQVETPQSHVHAGMGHGKTGR